MTKPDLNGWHYAALSWIASAVIQLVWIGNPAIGGMQLLIAWMNWTAGNNKTDPDD